MDQAPAAASAPPAQAPSQGRLGHFIQNYSSFLSSFVIGLAGLFATSIYQCNQSDLARRQAESQQRIAQTQAENSWRIERAKILSDNLRVLTAQGQGNVEQRYGVLLSLTRGSILDPELAVSYALELGKENPEYMRSVLANTVDKDYHRLANAFAVTCEQRYGVTRAVESCKADKGAERSAAIADLISDELEAALQQNRPGPLLLLKDEHVVQDGILRRFWLFMPFLSDMYERRQWQTLNRFAVYSAGARLIATLALCTLRNGELDTSAEAQQLEQQHAQASQYLRDYLLSAACDDECKGKLVSLMLSGYHRSRGQFDLALRALLLRPRAEITAPLTRINQRLQLCQVHDADAVALRDRVLVPTMAELLKRPSPTSALDDLLALLALLPDPNPTTEAGALKPWQELVDALQRPPRSPKALADRRAAVRARRASPTAAMRKASFCNLEDAAGEAPVEDEAE